MGLIDNVHLMAGIPYWEAIVVATVGIRLCLFPVALKTIQGAARMACMRPEMQKVQDALTKDPNFDDTRVKAKYQEQMQALFVKYKVNPLRAVMWPLFQFPVFIALFLALRDMGTFYPGFATGGAFWFIDLSMPDAWLILPIFNSLSFLAMIELGSDGVQVSQQGTFKWAMRGLGVAMVPLTMSMPQGLFIYWSTNNSISVIQTVLLKQKALREFFDIPEAP
ncbi:cytochrome oxidase biogenesis family, partial [Ochromonadaceae sp. CCMP2298]